MGVCTSDPLTYLIKQYGGDVCKFIVAEKSQEFVDDTAPKIKERAKEQIDNSSKDIHNTMDEKQQTVHTNFKSTVDDLNKSDPDAINKATTASGKSTEQLLGLNSMKTQIGNIKGQADKKIGEQSNSIMKIIDQQKDKMKQQIKDNKPSLPLYENMPICLKQKVLGDGKQKFAGEIKASQDKITQTFQNAINMDGISKNLKAASGSDRISQIADDSKSTFQKAKKMMTMSKGGCFG